MAEAMERAKGEGTLKCPHWIPPKRMTRTDQRRHESERIMELRAEGLQPRQISERLGIPVTRVYDVIAYHKKSVSDGG